MVMEEQAEQDINQLINNLAIENQNQQARNSQLTAALSNSGLFNQEDKNLAIWQADTGRLLERIEHYLRGDMPFTDEEGNVGFKKQKVKDLILLNDYGISGIMEILSKYIDKELSLSYFTDEERINEIIADIGDEIADYFLCNYDKMGMDTPFKRSKFKILVLSTLHLIEFTARKALHGKLMEEVNTGRIITQTEGLGSLAGRFNQAGQMKPKRNLFNFWK
jgi:hypothetical protein